MSGTEWRQLRAWYAISWSNSKTSSKDEKTLKNVKRAEQFFAANETLSNLRGLEQFKRNRMLQKIDNKYAKHVT